MKKTLLILTLFVLVVVSVQIVSAQKNCYPLGELDEYPVYIDTMTFTNHVKSQYRYPGEYHGLDYNLLVGFTINQTGSISNIDFPNYSESIDLCYQNVTHILNTAKRFIPGKKNGECVCTIVLMLIPYSDPSGPIAERNICQWVSVLDRKRDTTEETKYIKYAIPEAVFSDQNNWSSGSFYYNTGVNTSNGISATISAGKSIFWKPTSTRLTSETIK